MTHNYLLEFYGAIVNRLSTRSCSAGRFAVYVFLVLISLHGQAQNYTVNTTADGTSSSGTVNLRGAILAADEAGGNHTITVPAGTYTLTLGTISFGTKAQNITITGAGPNSTIVNMGTGANQNRIFFINTSGTTANVQTTITGMQFSNGLLTSDDFGGGGILAGGPANTCVLSNCTFANNSISSTRIATPGGAIRFSGGGAVTISNCTFVSNSNPKSGGGAIRFDMQSGETGSFNVTNSIFNGNTANAASANGGAISIGIAGLASSSAFASNITGNTFIGNTASLGEGGAISISNGTSGSTATINYNRFFNNTASTNSTRSAVTVAGASGNVDLSNNWWGCNSGPTGCADKAANNGSGSGTNTYTPYLQLRTTSIPASLCGGGASTITSSFTLNSTSQTIATSNLSAFTGVPISFSSTSGTITNAQTTIQTNGLATATYTAGTTPGTGTVNALVDNVPNTDVTARASITIIAAPAISTPPAPVIACVGSTASFSAVASGSGTLSFQWYKGNTLLSNGPTGTGSIIAITSTATTSRLTIMNVSATDAATNYSVQVTSSTGSCTTNSTNAALTVNNPPPATLSNNGPLSCTVTSVTLTASGGSTYQFSTGATQVGNGPTATVSTTGVYSVTVVGAGGCSATASTTVTDSGGSLIAFTGQPSSASTVTVGAVVTTPVSITSTGQGTGPITYQWYKDNLSSPVTGQTSATLTLTNVQLSDAGSYSVVAVGACNSVTSTAFNLTVNPNAVPLSLTLTASPATLLTTGTTTLSATVSGGTTPYSYVFTGPGTIAQTPASNTASVSGLPAGVQTFTVVVSDTSPTSQTITGTVSVTVSQANTPPVTTANANQTATVGQAFSYTVTAFTDSETPSGLTYTASIDPVNDFSFDPATRILSGTPSLTGVSSVTITATDPGSLSASTSFTITVNPAPVTPTITVTPTSLNNFLYTTQSDGSAAQSYTVSASGLSTNLTITPPSPYLVSLDNSSFSQSLSIAAPNGTVAPTQVYVILVTSTAGTYTGTISNVSGTASASVSVSGEVRQATLTVTPTDLSNFTTTVGTPSAIQTYTVTTLNQTGGTITAPAGFEIRRPGQGASFGSTASIDFSLSTTSFAVEVRLTGASAGPVSGSIAHTASPKPLTATVTVSGQVNEVVEPPTAPFSITGMTTLDCTPVANRINVNFNPRYAGLNGQPISFSVVNELSPTTASGPYTLQLYTDNPTITLKATQSGTVGEASFTYNWLAACNSLSMVTPNNTAPTTTGIANQSGTVNQGFSLNVASSFSDAETPNTLSYSATGLPAGLSLSGSTISGTPSTSGVSTVTVRATDPGSLSVATQFTLTVSPAASMTSTGAFSITGVTTIDCTPVANRFSINFNPQYAGLNGQTIRFQVANELSPTTAPGPYSLTLYPDNPVITLRATQSGTAGESTFSYNWLAACNSLSMVTPNNTAPTTTGIANQSGTVNQGFSLNVASSFSDAETPNNLTYSATGLPAGLSLSGSTISGTPSVSGVSTVTVRATDPGSLSVATSFTLTVSPASTTVSPPPTSPFSITGVTTVSCSVLSAGQRELRFTPQYAGTNGQPISFSVVNELSPTTAPGPYTLRLYTDNPTITLKATQSGTAGEASFSYNWLAACSNGSGARLGAEPTAALEVRILGNPTLTETIEVEVSGAEGESLRLQAVDGLGHVASDVLVEQAASVEQVSVRLNRSAGIYFLRVTTPTKQQVVKVIKF